MNDHTAIHEKKVKKLKCQWCEQNLIAEPYFFCPLCKGPSRRWNWIISFLKVAIVPLILWLLAMVFNNYQKEKDYRLSLEQKYVQLAQATEDFRKAGVEIELACSGVDKMTCYQKLSTGIANLDAAFNKIGSMIFPFMAFVQEKGQQKLVNDMHSTWVQCFQIPYYGNENGLPIEERNWQKFREILKSYCKNGGCDLIAGEKAEQLVFEIFSGKCYESIPEKSRSLMWFTDQAREIINAKLPCDYPGKRPSSVK